MAASKIVEGWETFERWAKRFYNGAEDERYTFCLSKWYEIEKWHIETFFDDPATYDDMADDAGDLRKRANEKIAFLRDYFVNISFDGGDFQKKVQNILKYQSPKMCKSGYGLWFGKLDIGAEIFQNTLHFRGFEVCLFVERLSHLDFFSIMECCPYDILFIRNRRGQSWTSESEEACKAEILEDLSFDGIKVKLQRHFSGKGLWSAGPILALHLKIISPKNIYFDYRKSK